MPTVIDLSSLGSAGFIIQGAAAYDLVGRSVSSAGDVNGDGFDDLIVGAPFLDAGKAYVIFGKAGGFGMIDLANLGTAGFIIHGDGAGDNAATSVSSAGDVNGDGFDDLIVGAPFADEGDSSHAGKAYVIFGKAGGFAAIDLASLGPADGFAIQGDQTGDKAGFSVSGAGDINGDGFDDMIVGAPHGGDSPYVGGGDHGEAYVIFGKASGFSTVDLTTFNPADPGHDPAAGFMIFQNGMISNTGNSVASAGDVNADGYDDLIIGAPGGAAAYVLFGKASGFGRIDLPGLAPEDGFTIQGKAGSYAGNSVSSAGDVNGDGFDDLIVGAPFSSEGEAYQGAAYVIFGKSGGFGTIQLANLGAAGFIILGDATGDMAGYSVSGAGDVNGDGFDDLIVGAPYGDDGGPAAGEAYVIFGKADGFGTIDLSSLGDAGFIVQGDARADLAGSSVSSAGDINGDGFDDLIVGARYGNDGGTDAGEAYVIFGIAPPTAVVRTGTVASQNLAGGDFDDQLYGLGGDDILYGNGGSDLLEGGDGNDFLRGGLGADALYGGDGLDLLYGAEGSDFIDGGAGADAMEGGSGDDVYIVDNAGDVVVERADEGNDVVYALASYQLTGGSHVETLAAIDNSLTTALALIGNEFSNTIYGNEGANFIDGNGGADALAGFGGDDAYVVDTTADRVFEDVGRGNDVVYATASFALGGGSEIETLAAQDNGATTALALIGNEFANTVYGNNGANFIDGNGGADALAGFGGDDAYVVDTTADRVFEDIGRGNDIVYATASFALGGGSEIETLAAQDNSLTAAINLVGNEFANNILGNAGANYIDGNSGADVLRGFGGDDLYVVDQAGDVVIEAAGGGNDIVYALASYTLGAGVSVETLSVTDNSAVNAIDLNGNEFGNTIFGNNGANLLDGGGGNDVLRGFGGADTFAFTTALGAGNVDAIIDFAGGTDKIALDDAMFAGLGLGALNPNAFAIGAQAGDADDRIVYNSATGQLFFDADGNGAGAAIQFATLTSAPALTATDFTVI